jgi:hypothetical protein
MCLDVALYATMPTFSKEGSMRFALAVSVLAVSLAGCVTPPKSFDVKASREYAADKEQIWQNLMRFFAALGSKRTKQSLWPYNDIVIWRKR